MKKNKTLTLIKTKIGGVEKTKSLSDSGIVRTLSLSDSSAGKSLDIAEVAKKYPGTFEDLKRAGLADVEPGQSLTITICQTCGENIQAPPGACAACPNCGEKTHGC